MGLVYVDSVEAVYGTAYGVVLATKVALLRILLLFGFMDNRIGARGQRGDSSAPVLRLPPADRRLPGCIWPICFALVGLALLDYREA